MGGGVHGGDGPGRRPSADDLVIVDAGATVPGDGEVVQGAASVDESAITGESAPVIREAGGDRSGVTGGTTVLSDRIIIQHHHPAPARPSSTG
ncbi:Potassium-transporting ATPase ATP-binding subunit [Streptomyces rimosus subsp. rimosus]